jgi:hypothetical protein
VKGSTRLIVERGDRTSELAVALLMTPTPEDTFVMRVPRAAFESDVLFVLRCPGLAKPTLARSLAVSELVGVRYDLVTAVVVDPASEGANTHLRAVRHEPTGASSSGTDRPLSSSAAELAAQRESLAALLQAQRPRVSRHASATAVDVDGVRTIVEELSMTLLSPVEAGEPVTLSVARGQIAPGVCFALRYFDNSGARRALVQARGVRALPGMLDEVEGTLIGPPARAEERQSYRAPYETSFTASVISRGGRRVRGLMIDLSACGIGFRSPTQLEPGDRLRIDDPALPQIDGAELRVVRRDPRDRQRYGAAFTEPDRGAAALLYVLGLSREEREHRRRLQVDAIRRRRQATATPLAAGDAASRRNARMGTREHS